MVRGGGQAGLRRDHPRTRDGSAHPRYPRARGRGRHHHPLELPQRHDHPQGWRCPGGRLHCGVQARRGQPAVGAGAGGAGRPCRHPRRCVQRGDHRAGGHGGRRTVRQSPGPQAVLHRLHQGGQAAHETVCRHPQAPVPGTGRQRALHRLRRRRPGRGGTGCHGLQVPQCRPDLCVRQPPAGAGRHL